jgi:hypothetical protein
MVRLPDETRVRIERAIRTYPTASDRALARSVSVTPTSIGRWRRKLGMPRVEGPPMQRIERLTLSLGRLYPSVDVDTLVSTCDPGHRRGRALTLRRLAAWIGQYADALDPQPQALRPQTAKPLAAEQPRAVPKPGRRASDG